MSIKGIDTQIMITRIADVARDNTAMQRIPQASQETMAARHIQQSAQAQQQVQDAEQSDMNNIHPDAEGGGMGAGGGSEGSGEEEEMTEEQARELLVAPAEYDQIIDIMI